MRAWTAAARRASLAARGAPPLRPAAAALLGPLRAQQSPALAGHRHDRRHGAAAPRAACLTTSAGAADARTCWNCGAAVGPEDLFCRSCEHLLAPDETASHFDVFGLDEAFDVDVAQLEKKFWALQKELHPDRFGYRHETEQEHSAEHSSRVNDAYKVLRSPIDRAIYMLEKRGVSALSEGGSSDMDPALLMKIMEAREELAELESVEDLARLEASARADEERNEAELSAAFAANDLDTATRAAIELRYATKLREEIEAKRVSQM